jgi:hypothetical protein
VEVPPASLPKLAFELLREKFSGQLSAVDAFRDWCRTHCVQHEFDSWVGGPCCTVMTSVMGQNR